MKKEIIGNCPVDSGSLMIVDPCVVFHTRHGDGVYNVEAEYVMDAFGIKLLNRIIIDFGK